VAAVVDIVRARHEQIGAIVGLWVELADYHRSLGAFSPIHPGREDPPERLAEFLESYLAHPDTLVLAALSGTEVVGFSFSFVAVYPPVFRNENHGFISQLAVTEPYRGRGIGTAMVRQIREWFWGRGITRIELHVSPANAGGRRFWERQGFSDYEAVMVFDGDR
jgi:GNAT superfamily N-acetyltransferase